MSKNLRHDAKNLTPWVTSRRMVLHAHRCRLQPCQVAEIAGRDLGLRLIAPEAGQKRPASGNSPPRMTDAVG